jgi:hypothetical protein
VDSEHKIQSEIMLALSAHQCTVFRSNAGKIKYTDQRTGQTRTIVLFPKGFPDLCGFRHSDGRFFVIEVKNAKGRLRDDQKRFATFIQKYPVLYGVARSADDALAIISDG